jgi:class 3 adenylate cyclase
MASSRENIEERFAILTDAEKIPLEGYELFLDFISNAPDEELFRMSPYRFTDRTGIPQQQAIDLFLYATHVGVLEFRWGVICPSCGAFLSTESGLRWVESAQYCALCTLPFEAEIDHNVEVSFTVSPEIRKIRFHDIANLDYERDGMYIMFSTSTVLHPEVHHIIHNAYKTTLHVPEFATQEFEFDFAPAQHLLLAPATHAAVHIPVSSETTNNLIEVEILLDGRLMPEAVPAVAPGTNTLKLNNRTNGQIVLGLLCDDHVAPTPPDQRTFPVQPLYEKTPYLTGKQLVTNQVFRDLFRTESIPTGAGLEFKSLTFLFTDLMGSTAMYERLGDFRAYALVNAQFALLRGIIAAQGGAMVKTMGDAIMASFSNPTKAVEAALLMRQEVRNFGIGEKLILKIGIHSGPTLAVAANQQLDYFGQTVNIANRVEAAAEPEEIVITESVYQNPAVVQLLSDRRLTVTADEIQLRGVSHPMIVYRLV